MTIGLPLVVDLTALLRLLLVGGVVFYAWPRFALVNHTDLPPADRAVVNAARMILAVIILGYGLAAAHLFNVVTLAAGLIALRLTVPPPPQTRYDLNSEQRVAVRILEELDRIADLPARLVSAVRGRLGALLPKKAPPARTVAIFLLLATVLAVAAWMRFWANWVHAAPPYSDFTVVMYWVKEITFQQIFPDGIYPKGFHIVLAVVKTLSAGSFLPLLKFAGPAVGLLMVASVGYTAWGLTRRPLVAGAAMLLYGTLPHFFPYEVLRQAGTDSQEFGNAMVLPVLYLTYQAWTTRKRGYRVGALSLITVTGFVHPVAAMNAAVAAIAATLAAWLSSGIDRRTLVFFVFGGAGGAALAVFPLAVAYLMHMPIYGSSAQFLGAPGPGTLPPLITPVAEASLGVGASVALLQLVRRKDAAIALAACLALLGAIAIKDTPYLGIHSLVITSRAGEFVALTEALTLSLGWVWLDVAFRRVLGSGPSDWALAAAGAVLIAGAWWRFPPAPLVPYRMDSDALVASISRIDRTFTRFTWLAAADDDGFDYVLGSGLFDTAPALLQQVGTTHAWPHALSPSGQDLGPLQAQHLFIMVPKVILVPPVPGAAAIKTRRTLVQADLQKWVTSWEKNNGPLPVFSSNPDLTVYELDQPASARLPQGQGGS